MMKLMSRRPVRNRASRRAKLFVEQMDAKITPVATAPTMDYVRSISSVANAEKKAISTGTEQHLVIDYRHGTSSHENGWLRTAKLSSASGRADVVIKTSGSSFVETFTITENIGGQSSLDDLESISATGTVTLTGNYKLDSARTVKSSDWHSEGTANVVVNSGPEKGVDYALTMLAVPGREYSDKVSGLTSQELVAAAVRNFVPTNLKVSDIICSGYDQLANVKIPGIDVRGNLNNASIVIDALSGPSGRSDDQIWKDVNSNSHFVVFSGSDTDIRRFADGGVTSILGVKFDYKKDYELAHIPLPLEAKIPLFGGWVMVDIDSEAALSAGLSLQAMLVADSRGYGLSEGSNASVSLRVDASVSGTIAVIGDEKWSLFASKTTAGVFTKGSLTVAVGSSGAAYDKLANGRVLYVTPISGQKAFADYLSGTFSASAGAYLKEKLTFNRLTIWQKTKEREKTLYTKEILTPKNQLGW